MIIKPKWGRDFWATVAIILTLWHILTVALMGNAMNRFMDQISEIEKVAEQQGGWVYFPALDKDFKK